ARPGVRAVAFRAAGSGSHLPARGRSGQQRGRQAAPCAARQDHRRAGSWQAGAPARPGAPEPGPEPAAARAGRPGRPAAVQGEPETILRAIQAMPPSPFARRPGDEAAGLAQAGQATTTAVREVAIAGELLTSLVSEFQSGASAADFLDGAEDMTARFRELLAEGRGVLRGHREISRRLAAIQDRLDDV